jgi:multicomponent Na+:H+ antiporter subunit C
MTLAFAVLVGGLYAAAVYMMLRRSMVKLLIGLVLLGHAANLLIFSAGGLVRGRPPVAPPGASAPIAPTADPLPQALVLTAIVIGFGVLAFAVSLFLRAHQATGTDDLDRFRGTDA